MNRRARIVGFVVASFSLCSVAQAQEEALLAGVSRLEIGLTVYSDQSLALPVSLLQDRDVVSLIAAFEAGAVPPSLLESHPRVVEILTAIQSGEPPAMAPPAMGHAEALLAGDCGSPIPPSLDRLEEILAAAPRLPVTGLRLVTPEMSRVMDTHGFLPFHQIFWPGFTGELMAEWDRLIEAGVFVNPEDRTLEGVPTEHFFPVKPFLGGRYAPSPLLAAMYREFIAWGEAWNLVHPDRPIDPYSVEFNMNRVYSDARRRLGGGATAGPAWDGLHLHIDNERFTPDMMTRTGEAHALILRRALTLTAYARPAGETALGGGLTVVSRVTGARGKKIWWTLPSTDNSGEIFYARTHHSVGSMIPGTDETRYSLQLFYGAHK